MDTTDWIMSKPKEQRSSRDHSYEVVYSSDDAQSSIYTNKHSDNISNSNNSSDKNNHNNNDGMSTKNGGEGGGGWKSYLKGANSLLLILVISVIIVATANRVMFKKMLEPMRNYLYFLSQLTTFIYIPIFFAFLWYLQLFTNRITPAMRGFPKWKFAIMGLLDASAGILMIFGGSQVSGTMQQLLLQGIIPFTMFFSLLVSTKILAVIFGKVLSVSYRWGHYLGAAIIIGGILTALLPALILEKSNNQTTILGIILFIASDIPNAFSGVYKEIAFKGEADLDIFMVNAWVSFFQFGWGCLFFPLTILPQFGGISFYEIPRNFADGAKCLVGINSTDKDHCEGAWWFVGGYMLANITYNLVLLAVIKYGSASLLYIASAVVLPLANISFAFHFIMGDQAQPLHWYDIVGLVVILVGLILYRFSKSESSGHESSVEDVEQSRTFTQSTINERGSTLGVSGMGIEGTIIVNEENKKSTSGKEELEPRSSIQLRKAYFARLGLKENYDAINMNV